MSTYNDSNSTGKKTAGIIIAGIAILAIGAAALYLVDVDQTKEAKLPSVSIDVGDGQLPEFDVDVADVNVGSTKVGVTVPTAEVKTKTVEVEVPVVDVDSKKVGITLPTLEVEKPREDDPADNPK